MSFGAVPRAVGHTVVGVLWRLVVFLAVALCFNTLIQLRQWYTSYAPSKAWAKEAGHEAWSPEVSEAAIVMANKQPLEKYPSRDKFYKALLGYIKDDDALARLPDVQDYRQLRKDRKEIEGTLKERIESPDGFPQKSLQLSKKTREIADLDAIIEHLQDFKQRDPVQEKVLKQVEAELKQSQTTITSLLAETQELVTGRGTIETGFQKKLSVLSSRINEEEEGIREAFDAVSVPARPVHHLFARVQPLALQIGDEGNPLHVFYLIAWYGLEAIIVLLLCGILVPWLLRLYGEASDPEAVQSKVTQWIKDLLGKAFTERAVTALAMAVVGSAAAAGVAIAAGDQPSILPPIWHDGAAVAGAKGEQGEPGTPGTHGEDGKGAKDGNDGKDGKDGSCDVCSGTGDLADLRMQLERQAVVIEELKTQLADVTEKADQNIKDVLRLNGDMEIAKKNMDGLANGMASLDKGMSSLSGSIGGLYSANQSVLEVSNDTKQLVQGSLYRLETGNLSTTSQVQTVQKTVDQAAKGVPPAASDVVWMNAVPDSAWARVSPFRRYEVTPRVVANVESAMRGVEPDQKEMILAALKRLEKKDKMRVGSFKDELWKNCPSEARLTLQQWTPLIVKLSRIQEQPHGE